MSQPSKSIQSTPSSQGSKFRITPVGVRTHTGSCHCGDVRFEAEFDLSAGVSRCNCSICQKAATWNVTLKPSAFRLVSGADRITRYAVNQSVNSRSFCQRCGIQVFGDGDVEEMGGKFVSINALCIDGVEPGELPTIYWDGRHDNWSAGPRPQPWPVHAAA